MSVGIVRVSVCVNDFLFVSVSLCVRVRLMFMCLLCSPFSTNLPSSRWHRLGVLDLHPIGRHDLPQVGGASGAQWTHHSIRGITLSLLTVWRGEGRRQRATLVSRGHDLFLLWRSVQPQARWKPTNDQASGR